MSVCAAVRCVRVARLGQEAALKRAKRLVTSAVAAACRARSRRGRVRRSPFSRARTLRTSHARARDRACGNLDPTHRYLEYRGWAVVYAQKRSYRRRTGIYSAILGDKES